MNFIIEFYRNDSNYALSFRYILEVKWANIDHKICKDRKWNKTYINHLDKTTDYRLTEGLLSPHWQFTTNIAYFMNELIWDQWMSMKPAMFTNALSQFSILAIKG